jgi:hypothetical protein
VPTPFPHYGPLDPEQVHGREAAARDLALRLSDHRPTALLAPRRYGKTSLVRHTLHALEQASVATSVQVDLFGVDSFSDFAVRIDKALVAARGRLRPIIDTIAAGLAVRLGVVSIELRRPARDSPDPVASCHGLLDVLTAAAEREPLVLAIDEFSDVVKVDGLDGLIRTHLQHHYAHMGLVFAGSKPSMMRELFSNRQRPFFSQADIVELGPLDQVAVTDIIHDGFAGSAKQAGPVAVRAYALGRGHPQRTMQLADAAWRRTPDGGEADEAIWAAALGDVQAALDNTFTAFYEELPATQGAVLRSVARTGSAFSASESRFHDLSNSSITAARDNLVRDGHLESLQASKVAITDPLFEDWLRRTFP